MKQAERCQYLLKELLKEQEDYRKIMIPNRLEEQKRLLRALMNVRMPKPIPSSFLQIQDDYLQEEIKTKGIVDYQSCKSVREGLYLWQGDITTLRCDAIVNAANAQMTGCYYPLHTCIDNCIHTYAGIQLRLACDALIRQKGGLEPTGSAEITPAFNLPCKYIIHTVGPVIQGDVSAKEKEQLASCYRSCLELASQFHIHSIAFCCISTGEFHFPNELAAEIAMQSVEAYRKEQKGIEVIFNVFKKEDYEIYRQLLGSDSGSK